ncbi:ATP cone domain-containing protein [Planctomycetota bacterium]
MKTNSSGEIRFVTKRDGHVTLFENEKLLRSVYSALESANMGDYALAAEVAELTEIFLAKEFPKGLVHSENISDLVAEVFKQVGFEPVAECYDSYRARRDFIRSQIEVRFRVKQKDMFQEDGTIGEEFAKWDKSNLFQGLIRQGSPPRQCESICNAVERQVMDSGIRSLSSKLVAAWVENEIILQKQDAGMFLI